MKGQILNILKTEARVVSGEILSACLGISRVAVWKHIKKLQEVGYNIEATPKGYLFISAPDVLYPWEFGKKEYRIHSFDEVDSTMDIARELARKNCPQATFLAVQAILVHLGRDRAPSPVLRLPGERF